MRAAGRPGRGERARVAARVSSLLAARDEADPGWRPEPRPDPDLDRFRPGHGGGAGWRERFRWDPGRRAAVALGVLLVVVVAATGWWLAAGRPHEVPLSTDGGAAPAPAGVTGGSPASSSGAAPVPSVPGRPMSSSPPDGPIVVDVAGKVRHPGIYRLRAGARVYDAVRAAGGPRAGASTLSLNLAEPLHDGEQIVVGARAPTGGGLAQPGSSTPSAGQSVVDLNTATLEQLETLPGVGPVLGQHILDWRAAHGQFDTVDQLREVSGIGDVRLAQLRPMAST